MTGVSQEYLRVVTDRSDFRDKTWFKVAKISTVSVIGGLIGSIVADPIGGIMGTLVGTGVGTGISLADGLFVNRLLNKPNPRRFVTDVLATHIITDSLKRKS